MDRITDEQLLDVDVPAAIAAGRLSGDPLAAAAVQADHLDLLPRSLNFLTRAKLHEWETQYHGKILSRSD